MQELGTYKEEYDDLINIYADMLYQYQLCYEEFKKSGFKAEVETRSGQTKKNGTASSLEILRKDIGTYSDRLGLNFKARKENDASGKETDKLASVLKKLG